MSKLSNLKRFSPEDFPGAPSWFLEKFLGVQNSLNEDIFNRINGDIGLVNTNNATKTVKLAHGVETVVRNPLKDKRLRPVGVYAIGTDGLPVAGSVSWRNVSDDSVGITVQFQPPETGSGSPGESYRSFISGGSAVSAVTTNVPFNVTSIALPAGLWSASLLAVANLNGATITDVRCSISTTSATLGSPGDNFTQPELPTAAGDKFAAIPDFEINLSSAGTAYFVGRYTFSAGTPRMYGRISAFRKSPYLTGYTANVQLYFVGG